MTITWPAIDKREHVVMELFIGFMFSMLLVDVDFALPAGVYKPVVIWTLAMVPGVLKELLDKLDGLGECSTDDMVWNAIGAGAGVWLAYLLMLYFNLKGVVPMEVTVGLLVFVGYWGTLRITRNAPEGTLRNKVFVVLGGGGKGVPQAVDPQAQQKGGGGKGVPK